MTSDLREALIGAHRYIWSRAETGDHEPGADPRCFICASLNKEAARTSKLVGQSLRDAWEAYWHGGRRVPTGFETEQCRREPAPAHDRHRLFAEGFYAAQDQLHEALDKLPTTHSHDPAVDTVGYPFVSLGDVRYVLTEGDGKERVNES